MAHPKILIATPVWCDVKAEFTTSILSLNKYLDTQFSIATGSVVYESRNKLVLKAINGEFDYILWLDSDMVFPPDTLEKLLEDAENGIDCVSGLYFTRVPPTIKPVIVKELNYERINDTQIKNEAIFYTDYPVDSLFEVAGFGFGCALTKTSVLVDISNKFSCSPFSPLLNLGEDYSFCWRANQMGLKLYCDSRVKCGHIGQITITEDMYLNDGVKFNGR